AFGFVGLVVFGGIFSEQLADILAFGGGFFYALWGMGGDLADFVAVAAFGGSVPHHILYTSSVCWSLMTT
ncbi:hypothetical protein AAGG49_22085, partial [Stenotrophomonas maltophilia]|uniref:hypothetical protein n=1 Tax=Stenotrophomonas maltophilia TaxID=40324 RepID=UPI00313AF340